ncbi:MAG: hypothetical protein E7340_00695 [Clostridiales bacterium]|nr:hypothetical protein [Clostridiales bacterium]
MKTFTKENTLIILLGLIVSICLLTFSATVKNVNANVSTTTVISVTKSQFKVMEEASIRIGNTEGASSGIRFRARIDDKTYKALMGSSCAYMGFLITPHALFTDRAAATDGSYGKDDYIFSIKNYVGEQGEGILVNKEKTFYQEDGFWYTNGAVQYMLEKNIEEDFTVIAYIWTGEEYVYATPTSNFARNYKEVVAKAYSAGVPIELLSNVDYLGSYVDELASGVAVVEITDGSDLYGISEAVRKGGVTFAGTKFKLVNDVQVDYDFVQIPSSFAGVFEDSNKVISIVNNKDLNSVFEGNVNVTCVNNTKVFNATEKGLEHLDVTRQSDDTFENYYVPNEKLPTVGKNKVTEDLDGDGTNESGYLTDTTLYGASDMVGEDKSSAVVAGINNEDSVKLKINYTKDELLLMSPIYNEETQKYENSSSPYGTFDHVKFTYALIRRNAGGAIPRENSATEYGVFDVLSQDKFFAVSDKTSDATVLEENVWRTYMLSIEDFASAVGSGLNEENVLQIGYFETLADDVGSGDFDLYILDIELVNDTSTILSIETNYSTAPLVTYATYRSSSPSYNKSTGECIEKGTMTMSINSKYISSYCDPSAFPYNGFNKAAFKYELSNLSNIYVKLRYTQEEIIQRAKAYGYNAISITYLNHGCEHLPQGVMSLNHTYNKWTKITLPLEDFCTYFGAKSLKPSSKAAFEPIDDYDFASSSSIQQVPTELVQLRCSRVVGSTYVYIGDICFETI